MGKYLDQLRAESRPGARTETRPRPTREGSVRAAVDGTDDVGAFVYGVADTVTFGFLDEAGALADHIVLGKDYQKALAENRAIVGGVSEEHSKSYLGGQLAGGLVGGLGGVKALGTGVKGMMTVGGIEGALYGAGSAEGNFKSRLQGAALGGAIGVGGGWLLGKVVTGGAKWGFDRAVEVVRWGKSPTLKTKRLTTKFKPADAVHEGAEELGELGKELRTGKTAAQRVDGTTPKINTLTGQADDVVEDGALFSMRELMGDPAAARKALEQRLGKLTAVEAEHLATRIENAMANGTQIDDPHFRSMLGFDLDNPDVDTDTVRKAITIMEDGLDFLKVKTETLRNATVKREVADLIKEGDLMAKLGEAVERSKKGIPDQVLSQHMMLYGGVQLVKAKEKYLPLIRKGVEGSREELAEALTKAAHVVAQARAIGTNAGRALQVRQAGGVARAEFDDVFEAPTIDGIREKVNGALKELGDEELTALIQRLRTADDIDQVADMIQDAGKAREWTAYRRTMNSVSSWLRSNALTPATGLFNTISFIGHDFFRNGMAKRWAARKFEKGGALDDALALRFELEVGRRVYGEAHWRGIKAMASRIDWEGWKAVERIATVATGAEGRLATKARLAQDTMLANGFKAPDLREFKAKPGIGVADTGLFEQRLANRAASGGAFARLINAAERAAATGLTTLDEAGQASMKLFTGAIDDYGRQFVTLKETYALSARYAIREAMEMGFNTKEEMLAHAQKRAVELAEMPPSEILQKVEQKLLNDGNLEGEADLQFLVDRSKAVDLEADRSLLMDGPQTAKGKSFAATARHIDSWAGLGQVEGVLMPYINTPMRILERGLLTNTMFGPKVAETAAILAKGGVEAEIEMARLEIGTLGIKLGAILGGIGGITLTNGNFTNSAGLDAGPPNRINFPGGGFVEIGRLDPFSLTLAMGAMWGQAINAGYHAYDEYKSVDEGFNAFFQTAFFAAKDAVLEKSYLTSLQDLLDIVMAKDEGGALRKVEKFLQGSIGRLVPMAGSSKQVTESIMGYSPEVITMGDSILRGIPGGSLYLSPRRDVLGDEVKGRTMGISFGDSSQTEGEEISPVKARLRELGIDITNVSKVDGGIALSSEQVSELRRIRGKEAFNANGETMEQALESLFLDPTFLAGTKDDRHDMVVDVMNDFNEEAKAILEERDQKYLSNREANRAFREYLQVNGGLQDDAKEKARKDVLDMGLPASDL
nr:hypothetical protein [uncultured Sphingomonas sp.]